MTDLNDQAKIPLLAAQGIDQAFGSKQVLKDLSLTVEEGSMVSLLGLSGSGKTSLFNILAGLDAPQAGRVYYRGQDITNEPGHFAYMLQKDLLFKHLKIIDNVSLPLQIQGMPKAEARAKAAGYFAEFGIQGTEYEYPYALSGGMSQRAALLRTFLFSRELMLLDEPFSRLDAITRLQLEDWFLRICEKYAITALLITHDIDEAMRLSEWIYILDTRTKRLTEPIHLPSGETKTAWLKSEEAKSVRDHIQSTIEADILAAAAARTRED